MSNINLGLLMGFPDDPRKIALVKLLCEKTQQGKVRWAKQRSAITANLPGFEVNFVTQTTLVGSEAWQLFIVRDTHGNELVRATPPSPFFPMPSSPVQTSVPTVSQAVDELFATVNRSAGDDLDRAISTIKNL
jgi:hypothetical protein